MSPFRPLFRNPHFETVAGALWPRPFDGALYPASATYYGTEPGVQVLIHSQRPAGVRLGVLLLVHGLEGSSEAGYMRSAAHAALRAGFEVHRMNIRGCGGTEALCNTLYHGGLTTDVRFVVERLRVETGLPVFAGGFSLGGNMVLKLAGELGDGAKNVLAGVVTVSTPIDLRACAIALSHPRSRLYGSRFVRNMSDRLKRRHDLMPGVFRLDGLDTVRTVYQFDDRITAPFFGFGNAEGYYGTQSAGLYLDSIRVPALLIQAKDDPMIPSEVYQHPAFSRNQHLDLMLSDHGGHVAFLSRGQPRFWADHVMAEWLTGQAASRSGNSSPPVLVP